MASALDKVVDALNHDSGFQLMNDMPLFKAALAEINSRLKALEQLKTTGNLDPRLTTTPKAP